MGKMEFLLKSRVYYKIDWLGLPVEVRFVINKQTKSIMTPMMAGWKSDDTAFFLILASIYGL